VVAVAEPVDCATSICRPAPGPLPGNRAPATAASCCCGSGGIGEIEVELLQAGAARVQNLELSGAYQEPAHTLAAQAGVQERLDWRIHELAQDAGVDWNVAWPLEPLTEVVLRPVQVSVNSAASMTDMELTAFGARSACRLAEVDRWVKRGSLLPMT
jgi:hypothetical protein